MLEELYKASPSSGGLKL